LKVGQHIHKYLLANKAKAEYGEAVIQQVAQALEIGYRTLYWAMNFYERFPTMPDPRPRLTWTHFRILLSVKDETVRQALENRVLTEALNTRELLELAKKANQSLLGDDYIKQLVVKRGCPNVYRIKTNKYEDAEMQCIDLGFRISLDTAFFSLPEYPEGTIIKVESKKGKPVFTELTEDDSHLLYTYPGSVKEIIDGDTVWVNFHLGFNTYIDQKIRLRGINASGIETESGEKAKAFISKKLGACKIIVVKTHYRDKYDRYLGDLFYDPKSTDMFQLAESGNYLNQELLDNRLVNNYSDDEESYKKR
jgi:endonuclease YncB( thermonuclease family)